jgi:hypothetical protein
MGVLGISSMREVRRGPARTCGPRQPRAPLQAAPARARPTLPTPHAPPPPAPCTRPAAPTHLAPPAPCTRPAPLPQLEDFLIAHCFYPGALKGKLDQAARSLQVHQAISRDVRPEQLPQLAAALDSWCVGLGGA